jgi:putative radical SAM enzyme (TIGR03279 family)
MENKGHKIIEVQQGSIAEELQLAKGDTLLEINGTPVIDVIDYIEWMESEELLLLILKADGKEEWEIELEKEPGEDLGLKFEHDLMDHQRVCRNKCVFCFVDQLPEGMRDSLYYKDDDWRLSFLVGNYITLTNLSDCDVSRIIEKHISPLYVSVHTTNPELRKRMLKNRFAGDVLKYLKAMADGGIQLHTQIVLCPGWNDGAELDRSLQDLWQLRNSIQSVAVVPVGLTGHRENLEIVQGFTPAQAAEVIDQIEKWQEYFRSQIGMGYVYASDEFYVKAGRPFPTYESYDDMHQVENGVGLTVQFMSEFNDAFADAGKHPEGKEAGQYRAPKRQTVITGKSAFTILSEMVNRVNREFNTEIQVIAVENRVFGSSVTVAGLVTGSDIIKDIQGKELGERILIPEAMLRKGEDVFLDDVTVSQVREMAKVPVIAVPVRGDLFLHALLYDYSEEVS